MKGEGGRKRDGGIKGGGEKGEPAKNTDERGLERREGGSLAVPASLIYSERCKQVQDAALKLRMATEILM